jgi:transposase
MQDKELYQHILGLTSPWTVADVKLDVAEEEIQVKVEHPVGTKFCCPECQKEFACYDYAEERRWRHLDSCQFKTILMGRVPRVDCQEHGVKTVAVPWALPPRYWASVVLQRAVTGSMGPGVRGESNGLL